MAKYRYDLIIATVVCGVKGHPKDQMKALGFDILKAECWGATNSWYFQVRDKQDNLPSYLIPLADDFRFKHE